MVGLGCSLGVRGFDPWPNSCLCRPHMDRVGVGTHIYFWRLSRKTVAPLGGGGSGTPRKDTPSWSSSGEVRRSWYPLFSVVYLAGEASPKKG